MSKGRIYIPNQNMPRLCPELAAEIGLNESIVLLQLDYWISSKAGKEKEGKRWVYESLSNLKDSFSFWSRATINRTLHELEDQKLIFVGNFNRRKGDKTRWFALNYEVIAKLDAVLVTGIEMPQEDKPVSECDDVSQNETPSSQNDTSLCQNETTLPHVPHVSPHKNVSQTTTQETDDEFFACGGPREPKPPTQPIKRFKTTGDIAIDMVVGSALKQERGIPDWAITGAEGVHPFYPVVVAFCEMTKQTVTKKAGVKWLKRYAAVAEEGLLTVQQMLDAHKILPTKEWGEWDLTNHKWRTPYQEGYMGMLVLAAGQIRDGVSGVAQPQSWSKSL